MVKRGHETASESPSNCRPIPRAKGSKERLREPPVPFRVNKLPQFWRLSRGPWLGAALALAISLIGRSKSPARATVVVTLLVLILGGLAFAFLDAYTSGDLGSAKNQDQENAIYRRLLLKAYEPITEAGGLFGWGQNAPQVPGLDSIDNEYLEMHLEQGLFGLALFFLLVSEAILALMAAARRLRQQPDFSFVISMLAVLAGILLTLTTVWISDQPYQLLFLWLGWSFSLRATRASDAPVLTQPQTVRRIFA